MITGALSMAIVVACMLGVHAVVRRYDSEWARLRDDIASRKMILYELKKEADALETLSESKL